MKKRILTLLFVVSIIFTLADFTSFAEMELDAKSVILIECETGKVLYEGNPDERLAPASVTKIMTMLLVMEALDSGRISLTDKVTVSENAASMGGSQVYLEVGETMSVDEMLKCVAVASANDAAVALAEYIYGSEESFVNKMNERAKELGMTNTNFENTNGLDDTATNHYTTARDIAIMSMELLKHEKIFDYTCIWMDTVRNGQFTLTNTNRLIRFYKGANGLKTGSTSKAKFCLSASAKRDGLQLVAVVMASSTREARNSAATKLLDYGFANYSYVYYEKQDVGEVNTVGGIEEKLKLECDEISFVVSKNEVSMIEKILEIPSVVNAPLKKGDPVGKIIYKINGEIIGQSVVKAASDVNRIDFIYQIKKILNNFLLY